MWDQIVLGFEDDETSKFGFKQEATEGHRCFETPTIATISSSEQVLHEPQVCCASSPLYVVVAVDNQVCVLNEACYKLVFNLKLESFADCLSLSDDSQLLLIGENNGTVHVVHIPSQTTLWSLILVTKDETEIEAFKGAFFSTDDIGFIKICILTSQHELFTFTNLNSSDLFKAIEDGCLSQVTSGIERSEICMSAKFPGFVPLCVYQNVGDEDFPIGLAGGGSECMVFKTEDFICGISLFNCFYSAESITKASSIHGGRYIIALDSEKHIRVLCAETMMVLRRWTEGKVLDFVVNEMIGTSSFAAIDCKIGLLLRSFDDKSFKDTCCFQIHLFPSFEMIYSVKLSPFARLINSKPNQDNMYVIEGEAQSSGRDELVSSLRIKCVSESSPDARLSQLLNKRKFTEAETFAKLHELNFQIIYKTKVNCMLEDLSPPRSESKTTEEINKMINDLQQILSEIEDADFIKSCLGIALPSLTQSKDFLLFCRNWLEKHVSGKKQKGKLMSEINQKLNRAFTFEVLSEQDDIRVEWQEFLTLDLLDYFIHEMKHGSMNTVFILWQRHKGELAILLTEGMLADILRAIPETVPSNCLITFLRDSFLPTIFQNMPSSIDLIVEWLIEKTHLLEINEKENWPLNGKELLGVFKDVCDRLNEAFSRGGTGLSTRLYLYSVHKKSMDKQSSIGRLNCLVQNLEQLLCLKNEYGCHLSLAEFCQEDKMDVIFLMLERISIPVMGTAIGKFLKSYCSEHMIDKDFCLLHFIKDVLQTSHYTWWHWEEAPWEERLVAIIQCIDDLDRWMDAIMAVVFQAPIPWSPRVQKLVETGLALDHPKKEHLKTQSQLVGLKQVLMKYELRNFPINNDTQLARVLVNYIFKEDRGSSIEDVLKVFRAYEHMLDNEAYMMSLTFLLNNNRLDDMRKLLSSLPPEISAVCCQRLLQFIILNLEDKHFLEDGKSYIRNLTKGGIFLLQFISIGEMAMDSKLMSLLTSVAKLQGEFNMYVPIDKLSSEAFCWEIMLSAINSFLDNNFIIQQASEECKTLQVKPTISLIYRLGDILALNREEVMTRMILKFVERNKLDIVVDLCSELADCYRTTETAETLMNVVKHFYSEFTHIQKLGINIIVETIHKLVSLAVTYCDETLLIKYIRVWQHSSVLSLINRLTQSEISVTSKMTSNTNSYDKWKFGSLYNDEGLLVELERVAGLFSHNFTDDLHMSAEKTINHTVEFTNIIKSAKELAGHLRQKGQELAAFRILMYASSFLTTPLAAQECLEDGADLKPWTTVSSYVAPVLEDITYSVVQRAIDRRNPDLPFILGVLTLSKDNMESTLQKLIKWCGSDLRRILTVTTVGVEFAALYNKIQLAMKYSTMYNKVFWISKQSLPSLSIEDIMYPGYHDEWNFVKDIMASQNMDLKTVHSCCVAFDLDSDDVLVVYLRKLLIGSDVKKWIDCAEIPKDSAKTLLREAERIIEDINNQELIVTNLKLLLDEVNPYCYEILLFIHEKLLCISEKSHSVNNNEFLKKCISLLKFLQVYKRVSPPTEMEVDHWLSDNPMDRALPAIAALRLPFHPIMQKNVYKIINPELTANTAAIWLTVSSSLNLPSDELIMIAVKNTVTNYLSQQKTSAETHNISLTPDYKFLSLLREHLRKIQKYEMSVACASWVTNRMPPGANKVLAAKGAVMLAKEWVTKSPNENKVMEALKKLTHLYQRLAIELVLHKHNLATESCLSLLQRPKRLIEHLIENYCTLANHSIKVCQAVKEISDIIEFDVFDIYFNFLCKWLAPSQVMTPSADESFILVDSPTTEAPDDNTDEENMQRAISFLLGTPEPLFNNLLRVVLNKVKDVSSTIYITRVLCCLLAVANADVILSLSGYQRAHLELQLKLSMCVSELESLRLPYSIEMFHKSSKLELVEKTLTNHSHDPKAIICCVKMCFEYQLWHSHLWEFILQKMKDMSMVKELQEVFDSILGHIPHIWHSKSFINAWNCLLSSRLKTDGNSYSTKEVLGQIYSTLLRCPCTASVDVISLWEDLKYSGAIPPHVSKEMKVVSNASTFLSMLNSCMPEVTVEPENTSKMEMSSLSLWNSSIL